MCRYLSRRITDAKLLKIAAAAIEVQQKGVLLKYVNLARRIAAENGIPVADVYSVWDQMEKNGIDTTRMLCNHINHPPREMHNLFADELLRCILADA